MLPKRFGEGHHNKISSNLKRWILGLTWPFNREYDLALGVLQRLTTRNVVVEEELRCFRDKKKPMQNTC